MSVLRPSHINPVLRADSGFTTDNCLHTYHGWASVLQCYLGDLEAVIIARLFARILVMHLLSLMTAVDKNAIIKIRHKEYLTEHSRDSAHLPLSLEILAGFTAQ